MWHDLSSKFHAFAQLECAGSSPLYETLCHQIAKDQEVLAVAAVAANGQPVPNLFFGAVQYLLAQQPGHALAAFYPSLTQRPTQETLAYPEFRAFVMARREPIERLLRQRRVQTNEVRRCAYLFPAMALAAGMFDGRPLALIEIGCSAGLNLLWDRYRYSYGQEREPGNPDSPVLIRSTFRGRTPSIVWAPSATISHRIGIDLNVIDPTDSDQIAWLRALIWPEHNQRRELLDAAVRVLPAADLDLRAGDGFAVLSEVVREIPPESVACVYHTHVANQIPRAAREQFLRTVDELGADRDVIHIHNNIERHLHLTVYRDGRRSDVPLARTDGHARWIEWLAKDDPG